MWEELSPSTPKVGLYDELAKDLGLFVRLLHNTHATVSHETFSMLIEMIIVALRHDNPHFNEARFRARIAREQ